MSNHVASVCARFGISLQPARPYTPTDKPVERWFRTLGEGLLAALPGYKGPDVYSRGEKPEQEAFFFLNELEQIIREWTGLYHRSRHRGLAVPEFPGMQLSPLEMLEHGITRAGPLMIPSRPDMALEFLEVEYVTIQHYGVEIDTLRYNGEALNGFRNQRSTIRGPHAGKWPVAVDSGDFSRIWFQDPRDGSWHELTWEHAAALGRPFSREAAAYARKLAAATREFPDTRQALAELLDRWGAGLTANRTERRMAVRLSQERLRLAGEAAAGEASEAEQAAALPAVAQVTARQQASAGIGSIATEAMAGMTTRTPGATPHSPARRAVRSALMRTSSMPTPGRHGERRRRAGWRAGCVRGDDRQYSPTRLRGWLEFVSGPDRPRPEHLPAARIAALPERERVRYNDRRAVWHANIGPIRTPQLAAVHEGLAEIVESNRHDGDKAKPAALWTPTQGWARAPRCASTAATTGGLRSRCAARPPPTGTAGSRSSTSR